MGAVGGDTYNRNLVNRDQKLDRDMSLTGSATDIVESELSDTGVELQEKRQRLTNTTTSTENGNLGGLYTIQLAPDD